MTDVHRKASRRLSLWKGSKSSTAISKDRSEPLPNGKHKKKDDDDDNGNDKSSSSKSGRPLAKEIDKRKQATDRLYAAAESYWSAISKKKPLPFDLNQTTSLEATMTFEKATNHCRETYPNTPDIVKLAASDCASVLARSKDKLLPIEALGLAMAANANTYTAQHQHTSDEDDLHLRRDTRYASHLGYIAAVHLALGELQTTFTEAFSNSTLSKLARLQASVVALRAVEKKCEEARSRKDAAERKRDKARLKGESKREIEEEARVATAMYDEALADLRNRVSIYSQVEKTGYGSGDAMLKEYLDLHLDHVKGQLELLSCARTALDKAKIETSAEELYDGLTGSASSAYHMEYEKPARPPIKRRSESASDVLTTTASSLDPRNTAANAKEKASRRWSRVIPFRNNDSKEQPLPSVPTTRTANSEPEGRVSDVHTGSSRAVSNAHGFSDAYSDAEMTSRSRGGGGDGATAKLGQRIGGAFKNDRESRSRPKSCIVQESNNVSPGRINRTAARLVAMKKDPAKAYREMDGMSDEDDLMSDGLLSQSYYNAGGARYLQGSESGTTRHDGGGVRETALQHHRGGNGGGVDLTVVTETNPEHFPLLVDDGFAGSEQARQAEAARAAKRRSAIINATLAAADHDLPATPNSPPRRSSSIHDQLTGTSTLSSEGGDPFGDK